MDIISSWGFIQRFYGRSQVDPGLGGMVTADRHGATCQELSALQDATWLWHVPLSVTQGTHTMGSLRKLQLQSCSTGLVWQGRILITNKEGLVISLERVVCDWKVAGSIPGIRRAISPLSPWGQPLIPNCSKNCLTLLPIVCCCGQGNLLNAIIMRESLGSHVIHGRFFIVIF